MFSALITHWCSRGRLSRPCVDVKNCRAKFNFISILRRRKCFYVATFRTTQILCCTTHCGFLDKDLHKNWIFWDIFCPFYALELVSYWMKSRRAENKNFNENWIKVDTEYWNDLNPERSRLIDNQVPSLSRTPFQFHAGIICPGFTTIRVRYDDKLRFY